MNVLKKLRKAAKEHGMVYTLRMINYHLNLRIRPFFDKRFDRKFNVDTCGFEHVHDGGIKFNQKNAPNHYEPTPVHAIRSMIKKLPVDYSEYTFIDFGSGKGRGLLLATEYPFRKIIGIELFQTFHKVATINIKSWNSPEQKCFNIKSICMDASEFELPSDPLVLFFFNPFKPVIMGQIIKKIQESLCNNPRPILILYYGENQEIYKQLERIGLDSKEIYTKRPLSAVMKYKGYLFGSNFASTTVKG